MIPIPLPVEKYENQLKTWPVEGNILLAHYTNDTIVVHQAYCNEIADYAIKYQTLGGEKFNFHRVTWVKPNFTWMTYRCGWAEKLNQERVLAIHLSRSFFDDILKQAVHTTLQRLMYETKENWKLQLKSTNVIVQWDPDHIPFSHEKCQRRAIQLGLRPGILQEYNKSIVSIHDITTFVKQAAKNESISTLYTPVEKVYPYPSGMRPL
jgi:hypothetical protein